MAWRFKASKYKNAAPIVPKPEACIRDICVGSYQTYGNNICASAAFMAFNWEHVGSSLAVLPLDDCGRKSKTMPLLHAHSDTITCMEFSPFHDGLLATASQDCLVKLWHIPPSGLTESLTTAESTLSMKQRRVETLNFHPTADGLISTAAGNCLILWDLITQQEAFSNSDHTDVIQSTCWKRDGRVMATSCKDKKVRIVDPRCQNAVVGEAASHQSIKDSRVVWLGEQERILTTGFDSARLRQVMIRDVRKLNQPEKCLELDCSTGILMPLFDADTGMLFLAGKGDTTINYMEVLDREPYLVEGLRHSGEQTKGACLIPKRALRVMEGEVARVLQLACNTVVPVTYQVPRKTYRDYHSDLYPDTPGCVTHLNSSMWLKGMDHPVPKMSLDPNTRGAEGSDVIHRGSLSEYTKQIQSMTPPAAKVQKSPNPPTAMIKPQPKSPQPTNQPDVVRQAEERIDFVNVKDRIKGMEISSSEKRHSGIERSDSTLEKMEPKQTPSDKKTDTTDCAAKVQSEVVENGTSKANGTNGVTPPKPLPRSSISEGSSGDENHSIVTNGVPKPRPRTSQGNAAGYKPRLGPKPFSVSQNTAEFSFERVFSVPAAPGFGPPVSNAAVAVVPPSPVEATPDIVHSVSKETNIITTTTLPDKGSPTSDVDATPNKDNNSKSDSSIEEDVNSSDSGYKPHTPSLAEKNKSFESQKDSPPTTVIASNDSEKANQSIAQRRKLYEINRDGASEPAPASPTPLRRRDSLKSRRSLEQEEKRASLPNSAIKRTSTVFGRVSKFRHLKGTPGHKSTFVENIKNVSRQVPGECDGFHANGKRAAVPLTGGGGRIGVFELGDPYCTPGEPNGNLGTGGNLLAAAALCDWRWDPFDDNVLYASYDDGTIREWLIPEGGLGSSINAPRRSWSAGSSAEERCSLLLPHPRASRVLLACCGAVCRIQQLPREPAAAPQPRIGLQRLPEAVLAAAWSPCGEYLALVARDATLRVFAPLLSTEAILSCRALGGRAARVVWALGSTHIVVTGFDKASERQVCVFSTGLETGKVKKPKGSLELKTVFPLDVSPAILMPHYDQDSSTLFLTGRGDSTIYCVEISSEPPFVSPLSHHRCSSLHQGIGWAPKKACRVDRIEFCRAYRLANTSIEPLSFTVPRIKNEYFQDDLFPPTTVTWEPHLTAEEWFSGVDAPIRRVSLQPPGMEALSTITQNVSAQPQNQNNGSEANSKEAKPAPQYWNMNVMDAAKNKQDELQKAVSAKMGINLKLEQDTMEGVDDSEWE